MVALSYMLDSGRVNRKNVWCLKNQMEISKMSPYYLGWELTKKIAYATCAEQKFEWGEIQHALEDKNVSLFSV